MRVRERVTTLGERSRVCAHYGIGCAVGLFVVRKRNVLCLFTLTKSFHSAPTLAASALTVQVDMWWRLMNVPAVMNRAPERRDGSMVIIFAHIGQVSMLMPVAAALRTRTGPACDPR